MVDLNAILKLEVETSGALDMLRNPSARLGNYGWNGSRFQAQSNLAAAVSDGGYGWLMGVGGTALMQSSPFAVVGGKRVDVAYTVQSVAARTITLRVDFIDAQGMQVDIQTATKAVTAGSANTVTASFAAPSQAVRARINVSSVLPDTSTWTVAKFAVKTGLASTAPVTVAFVAATWVNVLGKSNNIVTEQGNTLDGVQDKLDAGSLIATILDATLDPSTSTTLRRGRPVRLTATVNGAVTPVWAGFIETADVVYDEDPVRPRTRISLVATDDARKVLDAPCPVLGAGDTTFSPAFGAACAAAGVPTYDGVTGYDSYVDRIVARDDSAKTSDWIRRLNNTYGAYTWVDGSNRVTARLITYMPALPVATLSDRLSDTGALYYTGISLNFGSRSLVNNLTVNRLNLDETEDGGNKAYGPYVATESEGLNGPVAGTIEITDGSPAAIAGAILPIFATPKIFPTSITLNALANLAGVLALGPYSPIRVKRNPLNYDQVVRVLRVRHEISPDRWKTTLEPRPMESATTTTVATPAAGPDTGPSDIAAPEPGILSERQRMSNVDLPNGSGVSVPWTTVISENGITYDASNNRWVIPKDGRYHVSTQVHFNTNGAGYRRVELQVNGVRRALGQAPGLSTAGTGVAVSLSMKLAAGDVVAIVAVQGSGGVLAVYGDTSSAATTASITYLGA